MSKSHANRSLSGLQGNKCYFEWFSNNPIIHWGAGIMLVKNLNHEFVASNAVFSAYTGIKPELLTGLNDNDMPWVENKDIYINHEKAILAGHSYNVIEPLNGIVRTNLFTSKKVIYSKDGMPSGTIATAISFNGAVEFGNLAGTATSMKVCDYSGFNLTLKESKVLFFLLKGFSRCKISELAGISVSSHDFHLMNIKRKFRVCTRDQLVYFCYENRFHEVIPCHMIV